MTQEVQEKVKRINELIQNIKKQIDELEKLLKEEYNEKGNTDIFDELKKITGENLNTIILVSNIGMKYITQDPDDGFGIFVVDSNSGKGYLIDVSDYRLVKNKNKLEIGYYEEYDIPDEIIKLIQKIETDESIIDSANHLVFALYNLLKKYPASFVKIKYT